MAPPFWTTSQTLSTEMRLKGGRPIVCSGRVLNKSTTRYRRLTQDKTSMDGRDGTVGWPRSVPGSTGLLETMTGPGHN